MKTIDVYWQQLNYIEFARKVSEDINKYYAEKDFSYVNEIVYDDDESEIDTKAALIHFEKFTNREIKWDYEWGINFFISIYEDFTIDIQIKLSGSYNYLYPAKTNNEKFLNNYLYSIPKLYEFLKTLDD